MYVTLLFDIEDLVDPRSDDVVLETARIFSEENAPSTMMIVGEKARLWERRGRQDLIAAMEPHDVGMHTNYHSVHPTVAEYLEGKGWDEGIAEVVAREGSGVEDMTRLFGMVPSCWGRGGSTWGPQVAPALQRLGVPAMMYPFTHLGDRHQDVHRFCDTLSYYWYYGGYDESFSDDAAFERAWAGAKEYVLQSAGEGIPWLGLFVCHPATLRAKRFWDFLNFNRGINTPPEQWRMPEYRSEAEWQTAKRNLRRFASEISNLPGVQLRTVREVNDLVVEQPPVIQPDALLAHAREAVAKGEIRVDDPLLSPAEALYLWALWLSGGRPEGALHWRYVEGPVEEPPPLAVAARLSVGDLSQAAAELRCKVKEGGRLPASVRLGGMDVGPGTLYRTLAQVRAGNLTDTVDVNPGPEVPAIGETLRKEVAEGVPGWMHNPELDVTNHAAYTRLQSWTLKPVRLR